MIRIDERLKNKPFTFVLVYHLADDMSLTGSFSPVPALQEYNTSFRSAKDDVDNLRKPGYNKIAIWIGRIF